MKVKVSARALVDLLAGRITAQQFRYALGDRDGEKSLVGHCLNSRHDLIERYRRVCGPGCRRRLPRAQLLR